VALRLQSLFSAAEGFSLPPILPAAAVVLITLFAVSLAVAAPLDDSRLILARGDVTGTIPNTGIKTLTDDSSERNSITEAEADIFTMPLPAPHYHDRYRFYHRYDFDLRSRLNPTLRETN
jgi:hypothetical protein